MASEVAVTTVAVAQYRAAAHDGLEAIANASNLQIALFSLRPLP